MKQQILKQPLLALAAVSALSAGPAMAGGIVFTIPTLSFPADADAGATRSAPETAPLFGWLAAK